MKNYITKIEVVPVSNMVGVQVFVYFLNGDFWVEYFESYVEVSTLIAILSKHLKNETKS